MRKKLLILLLAIVSCYGTVFGLMACNTKPSADESQGTIQTPTVDDDKKPSGNDGEENKPSEEQEENKPAVIEVTNVFLNKNNLSLLTEESEILTVMVRPNNATDNTVVWETSNPDIVTVSQEGMVTAISEGVAKIFVSSLNGKEDICEITVSENTHGFIYKEYGNGYAVIGYNATEKVVHIHSKYKNKPIVAIGAISDSEALNLFVPLTETAKLELGGLYKNLTIEEIVLPETISDINAYAFAGCQNLNKVTFNEGLTHLGAYSLSDTEVKSLVIPASLQKINHGLRLSGVEILEFKKISCPHIAKYFYGASYSASLSVSSISYWQGEIDDHFIVTSWNSKIVDTSSAGVNLVLKYPNTYELINRCFFVNGNTEMIFLYGDYEVSTSLATVATDFDSGRNYTFKYDCPSYIRGNFYVVPYTLKTVVVNNTEYNTDFTKDLDVQLVEK